jgi:hypothetical protein
VHEFLFNLIKNLKRDKISQWDKDNYTFQSKKLFRNFAEFVALHYALSQREDTEYWKHNFNKQWEEKLINLNPSMLGGFLEAAILKDIRYHFSNGGGFHCIAAGMHWGPTNIESILYTNVHETLNNFKKKVLPNINNMNLRKKTWERLVKDETSLFEFLKKNIYKD